MGMVLQAEGTVCASAQTGRSSVCGHRMGGDHGRRGGRVV